MADVAVGDRRAWRSLVERHLSAVHGAAWHLLGDRAEAEDVAQETFLRLMPKAADWRTDRASVRTWLRRVAVNLSIDRLRARRTVSLEFVAETAVDTDVATDVDRRRQVRAALDGLPERQRTAIVLVHYQGYSQREAAEFLSISTDAVESLLARGRRTLKQRLESVAADLLGASR